MLEKVIDTKIHSKDKKAPAPTKAPKTGKIIDLAAVLQESIKHAKEGKSSKPKRLTKAA
jgi:non-homologous end joining protein Ku